MIKNEYISLLANTFARINFFKTSVHKQVFFIFIREGEDMKLGNYLSKEQKQQLNQIAKSSGKKKDRNPMHIKTEKVNWPEIMGMNRDIYTRKNGAIRRK